MTSQTAHYVNANPPSKEEYAWICEALKAADNLFESRYSDQYQMRLKLKQMRPLFEKRTDLLVSRYLVALHLALMSSFVSPIVICTS